MGLLLGVGGVGAGGIGLCASSSSRSRLMWLLWPQASAAHPWFADGGLGGLSAAVPLAWTQGKIMAQQPSTGRLIKWFWRSAVIPELHRWGVQGVKISTLVCVESLDTQLQLT